MFFLFDLLILINIINKICLSAIYTTANFMIVDCGGGTVDLTTRKLLINDQLGEITERAGDFCGSTFIDVEFIKYLRKIIG